MTRAVEDFICEQIAEGKSLVSILKSKPGMPDYTTVCRHLKATEEEKDGFCQRYAQAREDQADYLADQIVEISDDGRNDTYVDEKGRTKVDWDVVQRSKLRVDARKWVAAKLKPKRYGDRLQTVATDPDGKAIASPYTKMTDEELEAEYLKRCKAVEGK